MRNPSSSAKAIKSVSTMLLKKPSRLKSALRGDTYVVDSPGSVGAHACGSRMGKSFFSNLLRSKLVRRQNDDEA